MTEQDTRIVINRKLIESGWLLESPNKNVLTKQYTAEGFCDHLLLGRKGQDLAEAEKLTNLL